MTKLRIKLRQKLLLHHKNNQASYLFHQSNKTHRKSSKLLLSLIKKKRSLIHLTLLKSRHLGNLTSNFQNCDYQKAKETYKVDTLTLFRTHLIKLTSSKEMNQLMKQLKDLKSILRQLRCQISPRYGSITQSLTSHKPHSV